MFGNLICGKTMLLYEYITECLKLNIVENHVFSFQWLVLVDSGGSVG
jgi:hypothetical protein